MATSPDKAYLISGRDYEYFKRAATKVHNLRGRGIANGYDTLSIAIPAQRRPTDNSNSTDSKIVRVKVTSTASGGGKYNGKLVTGTSDATASGDLSEDDIGTVAGSENALVLNTPEVGKSTHDLEASGFLPLIFLGVRVGTTDDGDAIIVIDGQQWEDCT